MTGKRFQWIYIQEDIVQINDNGIVRHLPPERLEELLNELQMKYDAQKELYAQLDCVKNRLYDENEQLKQHILEVEKDNERLEQITSQFKVGDIVNLKFANEIIDEQRKAIKILKKENEWLRKKITQMKNQEEINCRNCEYFISDKSSSDCLKREDIGYKGTCIDGMDLHLLAKSCPYYR